MTMSLKVSSDVDFRESEVIAANYNFLNMARIFVVLVVIATGFHCFQESAGKKY